MKLLVAVLLVTSVTAVTSARILAVLPIPAKSHHNLFNAVLTTLAEAGHEVISFSGLPTDKKVANMTVMHLSSTPPVNKSMTKELFVSMLNMSPIGSTAIVWRKSKTFLGNLANEKDFLNFLKSGGKVDLIILEVFFAQEALLALGHIFKVPVINLQPFGTFSLVSSAHGNPLNLAYIPDFTLPYTNRMSFYQRAINAYSILSVLFKYYTFHIPEEDQHMRELFNDPSLPPLSDMMVNNIALTLANAHPCIQYAQPYTPNIINIGGIHLAKERKPLPVEMKKFLDGASEGAIYFSVGSIVPDHLLGDEYFNNFLAVFRRLPQRVLWKTNRDLINLPSNVMTAKWVPQQDVLAHRKIKVFITHGGVFSQHEAINAGVPVICTPYFGDQPLNAKFYEEKEIGVILPFKTLSEETIQSALTAVLSDSKYGDNMARMSRIYKDRPLSPADTLLYWVEYTIRHGGASHLRPASASMPFYQVYLLDVIGTILSTLVLVLLILYIVVKRLLQFIFKNNNSTKVVNKIKVN